MRTHTTSDVNDPVAVTKVQNEVDGADEYVDNNLLTNPEARPLVFKSAFHEVECVLTLAFAPAMNSAGQGSLQLALPKIAQYYNIQGSVLSWTITSYSLVTGATILLMAPLCDILGRKILCGWMNFQGVLIYFTSMSMQNVRKYSPILTTAAMLPQATMGILVNIVAAFTMHKVPGRILMIIGMCSFMTSALLWALQPLHISYWAMTFPTLLTLPVGADLAYNVGNQFSLSIVPPDLKSTAAGIFNVTTQLAASIWCSGVYSHSHITCAYWFAVGTQFAKGQTDNGELKTTYNEDVGDTKETICDIEQNQRSISEDK
ncbi:hypothetical protein V1520DRAFT_284975 [Lipomyces starkeyi]|uniref:Major facilitator superfamily (MFS) profile domain-containing protein n=1 Tax=Lipomyces starkeyi NRRL Y-11557 TaxID=675824 RepID=A0A1E3QE70_LIPST|nr:hypothetical protein LIPSTDRAFT_61567 [Lipomyces starkeyi NRRL Y-11557]